jgi:hypothetical protein
MSETYTGADDRQRALPSRRRRRPIFIAPKNQSILQAQERADVSAL